MTRDLMEKHAAEDAYAFWQAIYDHGREGGTSYLVGAYRAVRAEVLREAAAVCADRSLRFERGGGPANDCRIALLALADADDPNLGTPPLPAGLMPDLPPGWGAVRTPLPERQYTEEELAWGEAGYEAWKDDM